jgi:hypothetical protein
MFVLVVEAINYAGCGRKYMFFMLDSDNYFILILAKST